MRFLALGDSYTIGEGVADDQRWPNHLARLLGERGVAVAEVQLVARTAWTTDELSDAIDGARPRGPFDLVTLMIGVNDQYRSRPVDSYATEYALLLKRAVGFAGDNASRVLAISIPDWGATPFAEGRDRDVIRAEIDAYNARGAQLAAKAGVRWVNVTDMSRDMQHDPKLVVSDKLHPSGAMYQRWAELLLPIVLAMSPTKARQ